MQNLQNILLIFSGGLLLAAFALLVAGVCASILIPVFRRLFTDATCWDKQKPDGGDLWASHNS